MGSQDQLLAEMRRVTELATRIEARQAAIKAEIANHRDFFEQAPNITKYEAETREAQIAALGRELDQLAIELRSAGVEKRRILHQLLIAGLPAEFNDNYHAKLG